MIRLKNADGSQVVVISPTELNILRTEPLMATDLLIAMSPDLEWTAASFQEAEMMGGLTTGKILSILATSLVKPQPGDS